MMAGGGIKAIRDLFTRRKGWVTSTEVAAAHGGFSHDRQRRRFFEWIWKEGWGIIEHDRGNGRTHRWRIDPSEVDHALWRRHVLYAAGDREKP